MCPPFYCKTHSRRQHSLTPAKFSATPRCISKCHTRTFFLLFNHQSYSPGGDNVSFHKGTLAPPGEYDWTCASFSPLESTTQTANRSVQPFLQRWPLFSRLPLPSWIHSMGSKHSQCKQSTVCGLAHVHTSRVSVNVTWRRVCYSDVARSVSARTAGRQNFSLRRLSANTISTLLDRFNVKLGPSGQLGRNEWN